MLVCLGGYLALRGGEDPAPATPTGPTTVIKAPEIPPDTQGPNTVKGGANAIKGTQFKEGRPSGGGGGGSSSSSSSDKKKKDPKTKIVSTDDPLHGIN